MSRSAHRRLASLLGASALAVSLGGCGGYTSDYVPPKDGRARVLFNDNSAVASLPPLDGTCLREIEEAPDGPTYRVHGYGGGGGVRIVYWVPLHHIHPLLPPPLPGLPGGALSGSGPVASPGGPRQLAKPSVGSPAGAGHSTGSSGGGHSTGSSGGGHSGGASGGGHSGGGGGGGGGNLGEGVVIIAVAIILALPVVTFAVALSTPESESDVSTAIDRVNLYNDIARTPGSPCAAPPEPDEPPPPPPSPSSPSAPEEP